MRTPPTPPTPDRAAIGLAAENVAERFLQRHGLQILLRNYRRRFGELDIVALEGEILRDRRSEVARQ